MSQVIADMLNLPEGFDSGYKPKYMNKTKRPGP
jgi:hypothetical protein